MCQSTRRKVQAGSQFCHNAKKQTRGQSNLRRPIKSGVSDMCIKIELTACIGLTYDKVSVQEWSKCNSTSLWRKRTLATGVSARLRKMLNSIME